MIKSYYLILSRNDTAQASHFSGFEVKDSPHVDWIDNFFIPAVSSLTQGYKGKTIAGPLTFWIKIEGVLFPHPAWEIFVYSTPWTTHLPIMAALNFLDRNSIVCKSTALLPDDAIPCCQIFKGKLIRFYSGNVPEYYWDRDKKSYMPVKIEGNEKVRFPAIYWVVNQPVLDMEEVDKAAILSKNIENSEILWVRAQLVGKGGKGLFPGTGRSGEYYRRYQQSLPDLAIPEESDLKR